MTGSETTQRHQTSIAGRAFRRVGATVAVACALTGAVVGLGASTALADPTNGTAAASTAAATTAAATKARAVAAHDATPPKVTYTDADLRTFARSAYVGDALNLAAVWGTPDLVTAKGKAGAAIRSGQALPFTPAKATIRPYTSEQQTNAFYLADADYGNALGLATVWGTKDVATAKAKVGATLLRHQEVPKAGPLTNGQKVTAFNLAGYDAADAAQLASLWHTGSVRAAEVRAGATLVADGELPIQR